MKIHKFACQVLTMLASQAMSLALSAFCTGLETPIEGYMQACTRMSVFVGKGEEQRERKSVGMHMHACICVCVCVLAGQANGQV